MHRKHNTLFAEPFSKSNQSAFEDQRCCCLNRVVDCPTSLPTGSGASGVGIVAVWMPLAIARGSAFFETRTSMRASNSVGQEPGGLERIHW